MAHTTASRTCCIILGMHRSGTSCLARILHAAGLHLGQNLSLEPQEDNLVGHWESLQAVEINNRILSYSGGAWDRPPAQIATNESLDRELAQFHESVATAPVYGWKDPRTTLTLPAWLPHLGEFVLVGCFRHPYQVAQSLLVRENRPLTEGLDLWRAYNERLLAYSEQGLPTVWLPFDDNRVEYAQRVEFLCQRLHLPFRGELSDLLNEFMRHQRDEPAIAEPEIRAVYDRLQVQARNQAAAWSVPSLPRDAPEATDTGAPGIFELQRRLLALAEAFECSNAARQHESHLRRELAATVRQLGQAIDERDMAHRKLVGELRDELSKSMAASVRELQLQVQQLQAPIRVLRLERLARWLSAGRQAMRSLGHGVRLRRVDEVRELKHIEARS